MILVDIDTENYASPHCFFKKEYTGVWKFESVHIAAEPLVA